MRVLAKYIITLFALLALGSSTLAEYNVTAYCPLVPENTKLASIDDCQTYYVCQRGQALPKKCGDGQSYNKNSQTCSVSSQVNCNIGVEDPCKNIAGQGFVPLANSCSGFIFCKDGVDSGHGQCPAGQIFKNGECIWGECQNNQEGHTEAELKSVCEIMPNNLFFGSTLDCNTWQICTDDQLDSGTCPEPFVFDVQNQVCNYKSGDMCSRVTGESVTPETPAPTPCETEDATKADEKDCSKFFKCVSKTWQGLNCNAGEYFDINRGCVLRQSATPHPTCDRCKGSRNQFVNAVDSNCQKYSICDNGVASNEGKCPNAEQYFDEQAQACVADKSGDEKAKYVKNNGACAAESTEPTPEPEVTSESEGTDDGSTDAGTTDEPEETKVPAVTLPGESK